MCVIPSVVQHVETLAAVFPSLGKMKLLKNVYVLTTFKYCVAGVYAVLFLALLAWKWVRHPCKAFWRVKRRDTCPAYLLDPARGNHCYAQLKVSQPGSQLLNKSTLSLGEIRRRAVLDTDS